MCRLFLHASIGLFFFVGCSGTIGFFSDSSKKSNNDSTSNNNEPDNGSSTDNSDNLNPDPDPSILPGDSTTPAEAVSRSFCTQHGITWTFDQEYQTGQFANGDFQP